MQQELNNNNEQEVLEEEEIIQAEVDDKKEEEQDSVDMEEIVKELEANIEEKEQRLLRLRADFDNYKKRVAREKSEAYTNAVRDIVGNILPVLDNFERALVSLKEIGDNNYGYIQGVEMVCQQLIQVLEREGVEEIPALGENFDPTFHHAIAQEHIEDCEDNIIIDVLQKGYKLKDKVIRASVVKVCVHEK